jgi:hypothetical protein
VVIESDSVSLINLNGAVGVATSSSLLEPEGSSEPERPAELASRNRSALQSLGRSRIAPVDQAISARSDRSSALQKLYLVRLQITPNRAASQCLRG